MSIARPTTRLCVLILAHAPALRGQAGPPSDRLSAADKSQLERILHLKELLGDEVWPAFGEADIPLILYNSSHEFLLGLAGAGAPWTVVEGDSFQGAVYLRRAAKNPQSFAVRVAEEWAGSIESLTAMKAKMAAQVADKVPAPLRAVVQSQMLALSPEQHAAYALHETFHAFQAMACPARFAAAQGVYRSEKSYPFADERFAAQWNEEGCCLAAALAAADAAARSAAIARFLDLRDARRRSAALSAEHLAFERQLEWLEGLGHYVELRIAQLADAATLDPALGSYRSVRARGEGDLALRLRQLGSLAGDLRFYLSGTAQARLLDGQDPGWKSTVMDDGVFLEDLLAHTLAPREK
ncbi:MAG: hypothetical protein U1E76_23110 [Planctomycetota bacterium]